MLKFIICAVFLALGYGHAADEKDAARAVYNFSQLLDKAERIVLGDVGPNKDGVISIHAVETLKGPARDPKQVAPELYKRAEELLGNPKTSAQKSINTTVSAPEIENVDIVLLADSALKLQPGSQALFFLWEPEKREDGKSPTYRLKHAQNIYDADVLPQIRAALFKPRSVNDGRYLRDYDRRAAERLAQKKDDEELRKIVGGETVLGMRLEVKYPKLLVRNDNSFVVTSQIINEFGKEQHVYDGPGGAYGAIIRAKDAAPESAIVLRLKVVEGIDPSMLNLVNSTDFEGIGANQLLAREQFFETNQFQILKTLKGKYLVRAFYTNKHDGMVKSSPAMSLDAPAWTGTIVSKDVELEFKELGK